MAAGTGTARAQAPGALAAIEGRISQWPLPSTKLARDPVTDAAGNVYYAVAGDDRIGRFDPRTQQFQEWQLPAGTKPHGTAVTRDGRVIFVGNGDGSICELDPSTGAIQRRVTSSATSKPYATALDAAGNVWVTARAGKVMRLARSTGAITEYAMDGEPYGILLDARGVVWVTRIAADKLTGLDPATGKTVDIAFPPGSKPRRLAKAPDGMLWVSLYGTGRLAKVDPVSNRVLKVYTVPGGDVAGPYAIGVDARDRVWATEFQTDSIVILDPATEKFRVVALPLRQSGARNAWLDGQGRFWYVASTKGLLGRVD